MTDPAVEERGNLRAARWIATLLISAWMLYPILTPTHVDQLAELVDDWHVDVYCFGLSTDFRTLLLPGAKRLMELADEVVPVHVEVLCWCGRPGTLNARVVDGRVVRSGDTVVVADTADGSDSDTTVHYQVLCRMHHRRGELGGDAGRGQLSLDV